MYKDDSSEMMNFGPADETVREDGSAEKWKIIIADDEVEVHNITRMVMREFTFEGRGIDFLSAYSAEETIALLNENPDTAVILLDVIMESEDAGLDVVRFIRNNLNNYVIQIILRTGQAGQAPEHDVVERYEINDYKTKYEFTSQKLYTTIMSSLRAYRLNNSFNLLNAKLNDELRERKAAEEKIRRLSRFQESVIDNAEIWMDVVNEDGEVLLWNRAAERISGYTREQVMGKSSIWKQLYPDVKDRDRVINTVRGAINDEKNTGSFESIIIREDGKSRVILWDIKGLKDENDILTAAISLGQDITEKKQLENKLLHAQKMEAIGRLAGGIAHDFNNILTVISGYSELSLMRIKQGEALFDSITQIRMAAGKAESLTRQLLAFSRQQVMNPVLIDPRVLLLEMNKMLIRLIGEDVELVIDTDPDLLRVKADPGSIEQVIMNLVVNARDSMPDGGTITISMQNREKPSETGDHADAAVLICIRDTGTGMDEKIRERIFEPFFTTKEVGKGTGLGLSTVYGIVTQLNGTIDVWSKPGSGSAFTVCLPGIKPEDNNTLDEYDGMDTLGGTETILIVEDQSEVLKLTAEMLRMHGYTVYGAGNYEEAHHLAERFGSSIHLIIADIIMPQKSGKEVVDSLRSLLPDARILYMSGYSDSIIEQKGIRNRDMHMIRKPFTILELNRKVRDVLSK